MSDIDERRRIVYGEGTDYAGATFVPVCSRCGRFVKADPTICCQGGTVLETEPNATCKRCGRMSMIFEGFY